MPKRPLTMLMVDDNKVNLKVLAATFEDDGFLVHTSSSVEEARVKLAEHVEGIDLVLSDIQMPGLTGFDLVTWMKAQKGPIKDIPILLITSQLPDSEHRILGLRLGAVDYLLRSLDSQEIVIRVKHAIEHFIEVKNLKQSLEVTENLASTGRLFAATNHEIKNISQVIRMATGILEREVTSEKSKVSTSGQEAFKMLQQSTTLLGEVTKMIGGIISDATDSSKLVNLNTLLDQVLFMVKPLLKHKIAVNCDVAPSSVAKGNPTFLKQILLNLFLNAKDAIEEAKVESQGTISIRVSSPDNDATVISVSDNGAGLAHAETRAEFQPFATTKQLRGGTGLGLWLSSYLLKKMDGSITLRSNGPGEGAEARILLRRQ